MNTYTCDQCGDTKDVYRDPAQENPMDASELVCPECHLPLQMQAEELIQRHNQRGHRI